MNFTILGEMAKQYLNCPYIWGADGPFEFDCSGFVGKVLREVKIIPDNTDRNAQSIHDYLISKKCNTMAIPDTDSILFFGKDDKHISHIAIALTQRYMIHAGGGDATCISRIVAARKDARVKISEICYRKDLVSAISIGSYHF